MITRSRLAHHHSGQGKESHSRSATNGRKNAINGSKDAINGDNGINGDNAINRDNAINGSNTINGNNTINGDNTINGSRPAARRRPRRRTARTAGAEPRAATSGPIPCACSAAARCFTILASGAVQTQGTHHQRTQLRLCHPCDTTRMS